MTKHTPIFPTISEISKVLGALRQEGNENKYIFPIVNHSITVLLLTNQWVLNK